jgi:SNF2 family DNA or RNA helicase
MYAINVLIFNLKGEPVIGLYKFNVLITTYEILIGWFSFCVHFRNVTFYRRLRKIMSSISNIYILFVADNILLSSVPWRAVVIDEAHRLKNRNCKLLEGLNNLQMVSKIYNL